MIDKCTIDIIQPFNKAKKKRETKQNIQQHKYITLAAFWQRNMHISYQFFNILCVFSLLVFCRFSALHIPCGFLCIIIRHKRRSDEFWIIQNRSIFHIFSFYFQFSFPRLLIWLTVQIFYFRSIKFVFFSIVLLNYIIPNWFWCDSVDIKSTITFAYCRHIHNVHVFFGHISQIPIDMAFFQNCYKGI